MARKEIKGDDLLYRFFNEVLPEHPELIEKIPRMLILSMSIWFPTSVYQEMPVLLPWVLRDPKCRSKKSKGKVIEPDQWAAPNRDGYLRDDNSLVKGLPKSLAISSARYPFVNGRHLGGEFVASHIWRKNLSGTLASRVPILNTFVPNLVWLPSQVAKLSDREDGPFQTVLKEISWAVYRDLPLSDRARVVAESSWSLLPQPTNTPKLLDEELNWFVSTPRFIKTRKAKLARVLEALGQLEDNQPVSDKLDPSRYREGLPSVSLSSRQKLRSDLELHLDGDPSNQVSIEVDRSPN
jgi:hypothetical protein